jgi:putative oxidoreductase
MNALINLHHFVFDRLHKADGLLSTLARFVFAATLLVYFWMSGLTKLGDGIMGIFKPSDGAYVQIFPKGFEEVGYDVNAFGMFEYLVVLGGTWAEFILPALIVIGLLTRISAIGMIGFIVVQSLTDLNGHDKWGDGLVLGAWFDAPSNSLIMDQQSLTDLYGHGGIDQPATLGAWFDGLPDGAILDQRAFWIMLLMILVVKGAGPLSFDRALQPRENLDGY